MRYLIIGDKLEEEIGRVFTYFSKIGVAGIKVTNGTLKVGDKIHIKGATTDFMQIVESIEIDRKKYEEVVAGQEIGIKVNERVRPNDRVYKITEE